MVYQHEARGADKVITDAIDSHVQAEQRTRTISLGICTLRADVGLTWGPGCLRVTVRDRSSPGLMAREWARRAWWHGKAEMLVSRSAAR